MQLTNKKIFFEKKFSQSLGRNVKLQFGLIWDSKIN